jgi:hypothetical protein
MGIWLAREILSRAEELFCTMTTFLARSQGWREIHMALDDVPVSYRIRFEKDHSSVKVTFDLSVPTGGPALIADFQASVDGADLIGGFLPGQTAFRGAKFHTLSNPAKDANVSFSISSSQGWNASGADVLRGDKDFDDAEFAN